MEKLGRPRKRFETGGAALYVLVLLPFIVTVSAMAVDLAGWSALRDEAQALADSVSAQAAQFLPDQNRALSHVIESIAERPRFTLSDYQVSSSIVDLTITANYNVFFDQFIASRVGEQVFRVIGHSTSQLVPSDYVIVLGDGRTLRPNNTQLPWGSDADWPASGYWNCAGYAPPVSINPNWSDVERARWSTQSCFNPVLSNLKLAAMTLIDVLAGSEQNRIGVMFTPGDTSGRGYAFLRHVRGELRIGENVYFENQVGGFVNANDVESEASWIGYREVDSLLGDEACVLFSDPNVDFRYPLPDSSATPFYGLQHAASETCQDPLSSYRCGDFDAPHWPYEKIEACYLTESLKLREAIYWHAALAPTADFAALPNIPATLSAAATELVNIGDTFLASEVEKRGNIAVKTPKKIVLITDVLPTMTDEEIDGFIEILRATGIQLLIVRFKHALGGLTPADEVATLASIETIRSRAAAILTEDSEQKRVQIYELDTPEQLREQMIEKLIYLGRQVAVKS